MRGDRGFDTPVPSLVAFGRRLRQRRANVAHEPNKVIRV
jgi:hypothetical protein